MTENNIPKYIPAQTEMKKAVMMYLLVWILFSLRSPQLTEYEYFHLCQSLGWWTIFILSVFLVPLWFLLRPLGILLAILMISLLGIGAYFVSQAYNWKFSADEDQNWPLAFFAGLGGWILDLFGMWKSSGETTPDQTQVVNPTDLPTSTPSV